MFNFFFPNDSKLKVECKTEAWLENGQIKTRREFYTLRSLLTYLWANLTNRAINGYISGQHQWMLDFQRGAIAYVADTDSTNNSDPQSFSHTCTGSNLVLTLSVASYRGSGANATYNSVGMTNGVSASQGQAKTAVWYLANPATGANTLSFSPTSGGRDHLCAITFSGADTASPTGVTGTQVATSSTTISQSVTTTRANSFLVDAIATEQDNAHNYAADAGQTRRAWQESAFWLGGGASTKPTTSTGSYTMGWTKSSGTTAIALSLSIIEIKEASTSSAKHFALLGVG